MKKKPVLRIEPSIFAGDFGHLADEAKRIEQSGADAIHFDIMDGHFVPNLSLSSKSLAAVNRATPLFIDVHIMVYNPWDYVENLVESGADSITFHLEATEDVQETIRYIRKCGVQVGLALCPETPLELALKYLTSIDMLLLMTVHPGFGGQKFIPEITQKIEYARELCERMNLRKGGVIPDPNIPSAAEHNLPGFDIQVDGGIDDKTGLLCVQAGANVLVSGSYLFQTPNMANRILELRKFQSL